MAFSVEQAFRKIAHGNEEAHRFLVSFYQWVHTLDDLIDRDKPVDLETVVTHNFDLMAMLSCNGFFMAHRTEYLPLILTSALAFMESERFRTRPNPLDQLASQVLKSHYQEVVFYTAFLTGGFPHMLACSREYRDYDFDAVPAVAPSK